MSKREFTEKERMVVYYLMKYPDYGDMKLSQISGVNASTISAIKRRLKRAGLLRSAVVPAVNRIGFELILASYGSFNPAADRKAKEAYFKRIKEDKNIFYAVEGGNIVFSMSVARNYSEVKKTIDFHTYFLNAHNLVENNDWTFHIFPFEVSRLLNFFYYHHMFAQMFDIEDPVDVDLNYEDCTPYHLTRKEKQALYGLVRFPDMNDAEIASEVGLSRQGFANMRKRFMEVGLISRRNLLDLKSLGIDILGISHSRFKPRAPLKERKNGIRKIMERTPMFIMLSGSFEALMVGGFTDYEHLNRIKQNALKTYKEHDFLRDEPEIIMIPMQSARMLRELDFSGVIEGVMNSDR